MTKRERRWGRKKTGTGKKPVPAAAGQPDLLAGGTGNRQINHGLYCQIWNMQVDTAVCIVHQTRMPNKCFGCGQFKKG